ncbi:cobalt-precorrin-5B (C(1))-methyltransferase CbiD [Proteinivorax tanatarense]|uniref:Cobalt-precorrin-5B C(1)-methyltransferase n=1 Tax=Proteinivorax tanatarense TaxID=1260629 RepID=A0AAU7VJU4_9FIRM
MERYINKKGKKLRYGYTTGTCAVAAATAATKILFDQQKLETINVSTPKGWTLQLKVEDIEIKVDEVICSVTKDSGDDPDITHGIKIYAKVRKKDQQNGITVKGGKGIGTVTRPGLYVPVGEKAINPVPMRCIKEEVKKVLPENCAVEIEIFAPEGEKIAFKTFNGKLGIKGGISILGSTGIVEPMSDDALKDALALELRVVSKEKHNKIVLCPGNYGKDFAQRLGITDKPILKTSNFIGFLLDKAVEEEIKEILFIGHIGKMIKVAGGIFNTHSNIADGRLEILAAHCALLKEDRKLIKMIMDSTTTEEAIDYVYNANLQCVFPQLADAVSERCKERTNHKINIGTILFSQKYGKLGACNEAKNILGVKNE